MLKTLTAASAALWLLGTVACSDDDDGGGIADLLVGTAGGRIAVESGPLAGTSLSIPAGASSEAMYITVAEGQPAVERGWGALGPVAAWEPVGQQFAVPATMTLPYDPDLSSIGLPDSELVVKMWDGAGAVRNLEPLSVDRATGLVTVEVTELAWAWVAAPVIDPNVTNVDLRDYLPLGDGDTYRFTGGLVVTAEPGIRGAPALAFALPTGLRVESFIFAMDGSLASNGWGGVGFEMFHPTDLQRAPALPMIDEIFDATAPWELRVPPSAMSPAFTGQTALRSMVTRVEPAEAVRLTGFEDVVQLVTERIWTVDGVAVSAEEIEFLWLSRGVGPVGFEDPLGTQFALESAVVDGVPILPQLP